MKKIVSVLIVEDVEAVGNSFRSAFLEDANRYQFSPSVVGSIDEYVANHSASTFDVYVVDLQLDNLMLEDPESMSPFESYAGNLILDIVDSQVQRPLIVVCSAHASLFDVTRSMRLGADLFVDKNKGDNPALDLLNAVENELFLRDQRKATEQRIHTHLDQHPDLLDASDAKFTVFSNLQLVGTGATRLEALVEYRNKVAAGDLPSGEHPVVIEIV